MKLFGANMLTKFAHANSHGRRVPGPIFQIVATMVLSSCANTSLRPAQQVAMPVKWSEVEVQTVSQDISHYWTQLGDPVLSELVDQAIVSNLDIMQAAARLDLAQASLAGARGRYLPQVSTSVEGQKAIGNLTENGVLASLGASASWEIDLFGQISGTVAASRADLSRAGYSLADVRCAVVAQVVQNVIAARATSAQLEIARATLANDEENLQIAKWRNEVGLVSSLDVEQARGQRAQDAAAIPQLESTLTANANAISVLIGEPPGRVLALLRQQSPSIVPMPLALAGFEAPAEVLRRRPDVRAAEAALVADSARVGVAQAQLLPLVRLSGQMTTGTTTIESLFDLVTGGVFATVSQLIFDGGKARANVRAAEAQARQSLAAWHKAILTALSEVETAATAEQAARERLALFRDALDSRNNAAILARSQYQAGLIDFTTLLDAEGKLLTARNSLVEAAATLASDFVQLTQALGGGWAASQFTTPIGTRATLGAEPT